ncbi:ABC transporter b family member 29 chloroplastic [Phtheirospermum japonicum]|uniref:ABC transporter b family member 29 chloroplastic n=1 Tax=Phtheirospermum japonicum TaxID=374723 RepID=A0A830D4A3_9LAMI|nr:ABC transporter b family member 29 chloroplastic [Phtheirospermum japonicum]
MATDPFRLAVQRDLGLLALQNRPFGGKTLNRNGRFESDSPEKREVFLWEAALSCVYEIRVYVFNRVLQRDLSFFESQRGILPGDVAYRITAEAEDVADTVYSLLNVIPLMALSVGCLGEKLRKLSNKANLSTAALSAYLNEVFPAILFVKANNAESNERIRFQSLASADLAASFRKKQMKLIAMSNYLSKMLQQSINFDSICLKSIKSENKEIMQGMGRAYNELKQGEPAIERLFNLTLFNSEVIEKPDAVDLASVTGEVKICGLSFSYGDAVAPVLNELDLHIKAGETIALVGPSGGGKTTLAKLLLRLYEPLSGSILIDGYDTQNIKLESLRKHIGLVSQDSVLFAGTIVENIGYRDSISGIDMDRVELAAKTANADEFIKCLPDQIAIARALYQDPSILILDEATSALDSRSELFVRQALQRLMRDRTVLVIAHRLETVLMAERIFLLSDGKLQYMSHSALLDGQRGSLATTLVI